MNYLKDQFDKTIAERLFIRYDYTTVELTNNCYIYMLEMTEAFIAGFLPLTEYLYELHKWTDMTDLEIAAWIEEARCIQDERGGE